MHNPNHSSNTHSVPINRLGNTTHRAGDQSRWSTRERVEDGTGVHGGRPPLPRNQPALSSHEEDWDEAAADRSDSSRGERRGLAPGSRNIERRDSPEATTSASEIRTQSGSSEDGQSAPAQIEQLTAAQPHFRRANPRPDNSTESQSRNGDPEQRTGTSNKKTRASLKLASENMRGRSSTTVAGSLKWKSIAEDVRKNKIGVMALQETHLTDEHVEELNKYHKHLRVWNTSIEDNPSGSGGVAIVLNRLLTNTDTVETFALIPGRALLATWEWHRGDKMTVLAVYAPTDRKENGLFWKELKKRIKEHRGKCPKPDVMLGDFNMVEDELDRFPARLNAIDCPESFAELKRYLRMTDGWRETFPNSKEWTWRNKARTSMSRIDRIYMTHEMIMASREWRIHLSGLNANDHSRLEVEVVNLDAPMIGLGRWAMSQELAEDSKLLKEANVAALKACMEIQEIKALGRSAERNPQTIWRSLKSMITSAAKRRKREINCARANAVREKTESRTAAAERLLRAAQSPERNSAREDLKKAEDDIHALKSAEHEQTFSKRDARILADAETMKKSWFRWTRDNKPRDTFTVLRKPGSSPPEYVHDSQTMANIAGEYHEGVQNKDLDVDPDERRRAKDTMLRFVDKPLTGDGKVELATEINRQNVLESLLSAKNGSAAGTDGIIYEFWKAMNKKYEQSKPKDPEWADIVGIMTDVYIDIEAHGVAEDSGFADGWLCPLYKKGDRTNIENYRPITLLNTDYKIYTKALALKLAVVASQMIHESQAGFIRGRSITNLTKITSLILDYAEAYEENGMIVALDQEKAYDRIRHDYLSDTLRAFGIPERLIGTVESLYTNAHTVVMINGCLSERYRVTRGVRQGDPLSCLLFNLAIEPLAAALRASQLEGYRIEGLEERLIATLYADDTTIYLSQWDSFAELEEILNSWCLASGARFNTQKTEIIPLGEKEYRKRLVESRRMTEDGEPIPAGIRIARDGEPTRILGTWPGNGVKVANAWSTIVEKVQNVLDKWADHHPSLNGKAILSRTLAGGFTQYLTAAQGMPRSIEKQIDKIVMDFFWDSAKRHPVKMRTLRGSIENGGLDLFCAEERNEAQYLTWVGAFLSTGKSRPPWTYIADQIFRAAIVKEDAAKLPVDMRVNPFYQNWRVNTRKLPFMLQQMVRVAKKYGVAFDAPYIPEEIRENVTVWSHPAMLTAGFRNRKPWTVRCLKRNHAVRTVEDLEEIAELDEEEHENDSDCGCENCTDDRREGCRHPNRCQEMASELLGMIAGKWNMSCPAPNSCTDLWDAFEGSRPEAILNGETIVFQADAVVPGRIEEMGRAFVHTIALEPAPADETMRREPGERSTVPRPSEIIQTVVCAGMTLDGTEEARGGFAIHFPDGQIQDIQQACAGVDQTYIRALALGMIKAIESVPKDVELHIILTCRVMVQHMTVDLVKHERAGWLSVGEGRTELRALSAALRSRTGETAFFHVGKKRRRDWPDVLQTQEIATGLAAYGEPEEVDISNLSPFDWPGISLQGLTQRAAHAAIKESKRRADGGRRETDANIAQIKAELSQYCGQAPTTAQIWRGLRDKDVSRKARNFLWKTVHGAHKIGKYFQKMPSPWKEMADCPTCQTTETMEHILLDCPDSRQEVIWSLVGALFEKRGIAAGVSIGTILGCANVCLPGEMGGRDKAKERMYKIVVSESAFLAWKLRCEKRIEHSDEPDWRQSDREVTDRWQKLMATREWQDKHLAKSRRRFPKGSAQGFIAWATWRDLTKPGSRSFLQNLIELGVFVSRLDDKRPLGIQWQGG